MTTSDARKRLAERNAATQADTSVEAVALTVLGEHELDLSALRRDRATKAGYWLACTCGFEWTPGEPFDQHRAHVAAALADALNGAGVTGGGAGV